jgi:hypothetical protein
LGENSPNLVTLLEGKFLFFGRSIVQSYAQNGSVIQVSYSTFLKR